MVHAGERTAWETRIGLGLIGGLLAVLFYVAWRKVDSLLTQTSPALQSSVASSTPATVAPARLGPTILPPSPDPAVSSPAPLASAASPLASGTVPSGTASSGALSSELETTAPTHTAPPVDQRAEASLAGLPDSTAEASTPDYPADGAQEAPYSGGRLAGAGSLAERRYSPPGAAPGGVESAPPYEAIAEHEPSYDASMVDDVSAGQDGGRVQTTENDSFWLIAERVYGEGAWFKALYAHNRQRFPQPDRLPAGVDVETPTPEELRSLYPQLCPRESLASAAPAGAGVASGFAVDAAASPQRGESSRTYVVQSGQTLAEIAELTLGRRSRWTEIYRLNRDRLGDQFETPPSGTVLVLPETARIADSYIPPVDGERR